MDADFLLAKKLQKQYDEKEKKKKVNGNSDSKVSPKQAVIPLQINPPLDSLTHPDWETADPNPDIYNLFQIFDKRFFWKSLGCVEVKWSPRMTSCAGICTYKGRAGCIVSLSAPLLKLRPRKDLIETLLHEMIHAYLFVTKNFKDRSDHGPEFHKHMYRINKEGGTKITVYHSFHDEVRHYKSHWWRCDGPCQSRGPYYGVVKRSMNRAPGPNDFWFAEHQTNCGGTFVKIKEPEGYKAKKPKKLKTEDNSSTTVVKNKNKQHQLTDYFPSPNLGLDAAQVKSKDVNSKQKTGNDFPKHSNVNNVHGFKNLEQPMKKVGESSTNTFSGTAKSTGKGSGSGMGMMSNKGGTMVMKPKTVSKAGNSGKAEASVSVAIQFPREFSVFTGTGYTLGSGSGSVNDKSKSRLLQLGSPSQGTSGAQANKRNQPESETASVTFIKELDCLDTEGFDSDDELEADAKTINCLVCGQCVRLVDVNSHLEDCKSLSRVYENIVVIDDSDEEMDVSDDDRVACPCCSAKIPQGKINEHLDECLKSD